MNRLVKFLRLSRAEKCLLLSAGLILWGIRIALWSLPFGVVQRILRRASQPAGQAINRQGDPTIERIVWAVSSSSRLVPAATCLTQALTTLVLLNRVGKHAELRIGVVKGNSRAIRAHAWVESNGRIIIGNLTNISHFKTLSPSPERSKTSNDVPADLIID